MKVKVRVDVEYYFKDNIVLLHGRDGLPSMKADASGDYLLTRDAKHILLSHVERLQYEFTMKAGMEESEARANVQDKLAKLNALREEIEKNTSMLPEEISQFLASIYKI